ncbi:hypothetical protein FQN51_009087 [Onygenales sp. PD_10]|nr:hypothetical protein FQN51_009087 [Onygenales sp. PD_10]
MASHYETGSSPQTPISLTLETMPSTTILDYLTEVESDEPIEIMEWPDFTYETLMACYGPVLRAQRGQLLDISPPLLRLEREIFDENSLDHLLSRSIRRKVSESLMIACEEYYPESPDINMTRGGRARGSADNPRVSTMPEAKGKSTGETVKTYPDWAGVQIDLQSGAYMNSHQLLQEDLEHQIRLSDFSERVGRFTDLQDRYRVRNRPNQITTHYPANFRRHWAG